MDTKVLNISPREVGSSNKYEVKGIDKLKSVTYRTERARAKIPTALGAAADVPPCAEVHLSFPMSVVTFRR